MYIKNEGVILLFQQKTRNDPASRWMSQHEILDATMTEFAQGFGYFWNKKRIKLRHPVKVRIGINCSVNLEKLEDIMVVYAEILPVLVDDKVWVIALSEPAENANNNSALIEMMAVSLPRKMSLTEIEKFFMDNYHDFDLHSNSIMVGYKSGAIIMPEDSLFYDRHLASRVFSEKNQQEMIAKIIDYQEDGRQLKTTVYHSLMVELLVLFIEDILKIYKKTQSI